MVERVGAAAEGDVAPDPSREGRDFAVLVLLQPILFIRPLFFDTFFFRDLYLLFFGQRRLVAAQLRDGLVPLWDPFHHGGQALLANLNNTALYPTNLLYLLLPPVPALNLEIVGHLAFAAVATWLCARALGLSSRAALVAGLVFELCGVTLSCANLVNRLYSLPWLPLLLFALVRHLAAPRRRWFALATVSGALQLLAGFPEFVLLTWATACVVAACVPGDGRPVAKRIGTVAGAGALALGLAAVQLLPLVSLVALSSRGGGGVGGAWATWSVFPGRLPELVVPGFLGPVTTLSDESYWGRFIEDQGFPYLLSISFGTTCAGLVLASLAGVGRGPLAARLRLALAALAAVTVVASLGRNLPGLGPAAATPFPLFRYPVKLLAATILPAALLAADGFQRLASAPNGRRRTALALAPALVALVLLSWHRAAPDSFHLALFRAAPTASSSRGTDAVLLSALLLAAAFAAIVALPAPTPIRRYGLPLLLLLDLTLSARRVNAWAPRELLAAEPPLARSVRAVLGDGRLYRDDPGGVERVVAPSDDIVWLARRTLGTLGKYTAANFGIPVVFHLDFDGLALREIVTLGNAIARRPWSERLPALSSAGVTAVLTPDPAAAAALPLAARGGVPGGGELFLLGNRGALPSAGLVFEAWSSRTDEGQLPLLLDGRDGRRPEPRDTVVLTGIERPRPAGPCPSAVRRVQAAPAVARYEVESACDGFLVFPTPLDDGWEVRIDGEPAPVLRANFAFQAVRVAAGRHQVRHRYLPAGLRAGFAVSALSVLLLAVVLRRPGAVAR